MCKKMDLLIREAESVEEYLESWKKAMRDTPWFNESRLFDYHPDQMMEEIRLEFQKPSNIHLIAKSERREETVGVLGLRVEGKVGTLGRWEPAVPVKFRDSQVGEALLEEAFSQLHERHVSTVKCMLKFPFNQPQMTCWHASLYRKSDFIEKSPSSIMLLTDLSRVKVSERLHIIANLRIIEGKRFSLKEFADFTQKAYLTTPEDRTVHINDPFISNPETRLKTLQTIRDGKMGHSPPKCWLIAKFKDNIAGFTIGFIPKKSEHRPAHGVIGELGVFPEHRRKGIATALIVEIFRSFQKFECKYALVGTLKTNKPAIALYEKMGFHQTFELVDFEKTLT